MNNPILKTRFATFPRSGHHWLICQLMNALGDELKYTEHYTRGGETLEKNNALNAQKTHDFGLKCPVSSDYRHIVQIRDFAAVTQSWLGFPTHKGMSIKALRKAKWEYYVRFNKKWIINPVPNRLIVSYDHMLLYPEHTLERVIAHMRGERLPPLPKEPKLPFRS